MTAAVKVVVLGRRRGEGENREEREGDLTVERRDHVAHTTRRGPVTGGITLGQALRQGERETGRIEIRREGVAEGMIAAGTGVVGGMRREGQRGVEGRRIVRVEGKRRREKGRRWRLSEIRSVCLEVSKCFP